MHHFIFPAQDTWISSGSNVATTNVSELDQNFGRDQILEVKKEFFNKEHFTDVIAFRLNEYSDIKVEGEVYISVPQVQRNAEEFKEPFAKELARVIIHGNLHLLDYKDATQKEKELMTEKEDHYLDSSNWKGKI